MSTVELKQKVLERLETVEEAYLLEEILNLINIEADKTEIFEIPEEHKDGLEASLKQMDSGKTTSHMKVLKELRDGFTS